MKRCKYCGETKPLDEFYVHRKMADGRLNRCRTCESGRASGRARKEKSAAAIPMPWTFADIPTMTRRERLEWAASRYGLIDPSPDDILMAKWTQYDEHHHKPIGADGANGHVSAYHRDLAEVFRMAIAARPVRLCKVCQADITAMNRNKRYCGPNCQRVAEVRRTAEIKRPGLTRQPPKKVTDAERAKVAQMYLDGETLLAIQLKTKRSYDTIQRMLVALGVERRTTKGEAA